MRTSWTCERLAWALFNRSFSLKRLAKNSKPSIRNSTMNRPARYTVEEIEYARQDGRCTVDALNALKQEFDKHPIDLKPCNAYSPASVAKSYLDAMGIIRPAEKFKHSAESITALRCKPITADAPRPAYVARRFLSSPLISQANIQPAVHSWVFSMFSQQRA